MERSRKQKMIMIAVVVVAVIGLTVAFAAMSTSLLINGTASMDTAKWDIHFENLSAAKLTGFASVATEPELEATKIGDYDVVLTRPGDSVTYTFDVVNKGSMDAELSTFTKSAPVCTSPTGVLNDENIVCANLRYTFKYTDNNEDVKVNDTLKAGETKNITLYLAYEGSSLPTAAVKISELGITMVYNQVVSERTGSITQNASPASWFAYELNNEGITITGPTEAMLEDLSCEPFLIEGTEIYDGYICSVEDFDLIIPEEINGSPVTEIGYSAFSGLNYRKVVLPNTVTKIHDQAFYQGTMKGEEHSLVELQLSNSLTSIGYGAFAYSGLSEVVIPEGVTHLDTPNGAPFYSNIESEFHNITLILPTTLKSLNSANGFGIVGGASYYYTGTIVNKAGLVIDWAEVSYYKYDAEWCGAEPPTCNFATGTCTHPCNPDISFTVVSSESDL